MVEQTGLLINARSWAMIEESTGEERSGTTIYLASEQAEPNPRLKGFDIQKLTGSPDLFSTIDHKMTGQRVTVECEMSVRGTRVKLIPKNVSLAKG